MTTIIITTGTVTSADGTTIAYERGGSGPPLILISSALSSREDLRRLSSLLPFTVVNYDRRGRGESTDTQPYTIKKEVEDIAALLAIYPSAALFGTSSGAVLALDAASTLNVPVIAYEAPIIVDASRLSVPRSIAGDIDRLVETGHPAAAVRLFMKQGLGVGWLVIALLMAMWPMWRSMVSMAKTAAYDCRICEGVQDGRPLLDRWEFKDKEEVLAVVGENADESILVGNKALAEKIGARLEVVKGAYHASPVMNPKVLVEVITEFLKPTKVGGNVIETAEMSTSTIKTVTEFDLDAAIKAKDQAITVDPAHHEVK
ncbi:hypothetical protein CspHIS471_0102560 [Cutaneotrichosporon sp. HIS471]|nr:hypothetical protein CspHIS471_0102560 [Cutaneotrichosporon sp. HIS471]